MAKPHYGQLVIGPPGSGKTTYCSEMAQMLKQVFGRKLAIVNLDPANENLPFTPDIDVREAVSVEDVMELENLGPNGALVFAIEQLERDIDWLFGKISALDEDCYIIFDCPGQIELYTHHRSFDRICKRLIKKFDFRLACVHLVDSYYCSDPATFISVVLASLSAMLCMGLPHLNVLSKVDLIEKLGKLDFDLAYYTEVTDLDFLLDRLEEQPYGRKLAKLSKAICEVIQDFSLVGFLPMSIKDRETMYHVAKNVDRITGYSASELEERKVRQTMANIPTAAPEFDYSLISNVQEKYIRQETDETS
ncbi:GPN-loop GTPase 2 [Hypsibius exemplaris]|uniref:GPN-loop GTPase 2 n=1 Tax=Hypsibius exemplaris TaxID=2072580 RepID=A0A9X6NKW8_HYPEX|nr:GPN-loop GTPase 2 [Hypsibius exemplaris]